MMFNQYPYINVNDLNLDYILNQIKEMTNEVVNFVSLNAIKYADPIQWDITRQYEKNTVVIDPLTGTAYISVAPVPSGVALTRTEYWTVVFDLGSFVTRAAQNFTSHWEQDTTLTATFPSNMGDWLVWGDVLYKALTNITAGDQYVVNSNIEHFTIEDLYNAYLNTVASILAMIGDLQDLTTSDTSDIVHAINSVLSDLNLTIGDPANLTTSDTSDIVNAINSVLSDVNNTIGDLNDLTTTDKSNIVNAINEVNDDTIHTLNAYNNVAGMGRCYVDGTNGDDDNDGLSSATAFKSLDRALSMLNKGNISLLINIVGGTSFEINYRITGGELHIYNRTSSSIRIDLGDDFVAYNTRLNFDGDFDSLGGSFHIYCNVIWHTDFVQLYVKNTYFQTQFTMISSFLQLDGGGFYRIHGYQAQMEFVGTNRVLADAGGNLSTSILRVNASLVKMDDNTLYLEAEPPANAGDMIYCNASTLGIHINFSADHQPFTNKFNNLIRCVYSNVNCTPTSLDNNRHYTTAFMSNTRSSVPYSQYISAEVTSETETVAAGQGANIAITIPSVNGYDALGIVSCNSLGTDRWYTQLVGYAVSGTTATVSVKNTDTNGARDFQIRIRVIYQYTGITTN